MFAFFHSAMIRRFASTQGLDAIAAVHMIAHRNELINVRTVRRPVPFQGLIEKSRWPWISIMVVESCYSLVMSWLSRCMKGQEYEAKVHAFLCLVEKSKACEIPFHHLQLPEITGHGSLDRLHDLCQGNCFQYDLLLQVSNGHRQSIAEK